MILLKKQNLQFNESIKYQIGRNLDKIKCITLWIQLTKISSNF